MVARTFEELAAAPGDDLDVALGAALIARDVYGGLDVPALLGRLDELADGLEPLGALPAGEQAGRLVMHVCGTLGFRGNEADYYDPRNSLLPDVLDRRLGIPISLALVLAEIGWRRGAVVRGISFPGHFLVRVDGRDAEGAVYLDPFFGGKQLEAPDLQALLGKVSAQAGRPGEAHTAAELHRYLEPASGRVILQRWLMNLRSIYLHRGDDARALLVLDRLVSLTPGQAWALRERGLLAAKLGAVEAAHADLERALDLCAAEQNVAAQIRDEIVRLRPRRGVLH